MKKIIEKIMFKLGYSKIPTVIRNHEIEYCDIEQIKIDTVPFFMLFRGEIPTDLEKGFRIQYAKKQLKEQLLEALDPFIKYEVYKDYYGYMRGMGVIATIYVAKKNK